MMPLFLCRYYCRFRRFATFSRFDAAMLIRAAVIYAYEDKIDAAAATYDIFTPAMMLFSLPRLRCLSSITPARFDDTP